MCFVFFRACTFVLYLVLNLHHKGFILYNMFCLFDNKVLSNYIKLLLNINFFNKHRRSEV